jgi:hypothetical protein
VLGLENTGLGLRRSRDREPLPLFERRVLASRTDGKSDIECIDIAARLLSQLCECPVSQLRAARSCGRSLRERTVCSAVVGRRSAAESEVRANDCRPPLTCCLFGRADRP